ncbi:MAG TPA: hypothetical protein VL017_08685, partial [Devosia sp.]|nr:hypothetical protein [Devosia sp.]
AAIAAMLASMATVVMRRCVITGRWIADRVRSIGATPMPPMAIEPEPAADEPDAELAKIRELAAALAREDEDDRHFVGVSDNTVAWLSLLTPVQLARVATATDAALAAHIKGLAPIRGLVPADAESVAALAAARRRVRLDDEHSADIDLAWPGAYAA